MFGREVHDRHTARDARHPFDAAAGVRFAGISVEPDVVGLEALTQLVESGKLHPYVQQTLPLENAAKAHELVEQGNVQGKIVLTA